MKLQNGILLCDGILFNKHDITATKGKVLIEPSGLGYVFTLELYNLLAKYPKEYELLCSKDITKLKEVEMKGGN